MAFFTYDFDIGFKDVGQSNRVTNKAYLSFMEDIGGLHSEKVGYGMNEIASTHLSWILLGWKLKVFSRPLYGSKLKINTWGSNFTRSFAIRDFEVYDENNNLVAIATSKWVIVNTLTGRLTRITPEIVESYTVESKSVFNESEVNFSLEDEPENILNTFFYTILRNNIDINNHMHNLCYLDLAYEALPDEVYENCDFNNIEILYKKGCTLYNKVKCDYHFKDNIHYVYIKSLDDSLLHAIIKLY